MLDTTGECISTLLNIHTVDYYVTFLNDVYKDVLMWGSAYAIILRKKICEYNGLYGISSSFMDIKGRKMYISLLFASLQYLNSAFMSLYCFNRKTRVRKLKRVYVRLQSKD